MPSAVLPLHIFEPRYRALIDFVRAGDGLLGIATLKPGYEANYGGSPAVYSEIGVGRVVQYEELPDGRSNIVLVHVASARILEEEEVEHPFRMFHAEIVDGSEPSESAIASVRALVLQLGSSAANASEEVARLAAMPGVELVHAVARRLLQSSEQQRMYLGLDNPKRVRLVSDALAELLGATTPVGEA